MERAIARGTPGASCFFVGPRSRDFFSSGLLFSAPVLPFSVLGEFTNSPRPFTHTLGISRGKMALSTAAISTDTRKVEKFLFLSDYEMERANTPSLRLLLRLRAGSSPF